MNDSLATLEYDTKIAQIFVDSGLFKDVRDAKQAIVKVQAGREVGLQPFEAMSGLNIIQGKITIGGNVMASKIKGSAKYDYKVVRSDNEVCTIEFYEGKEPIGSITFTIQDAERIGLMKNDVWKKYPSNMLFNRAISNGVKRYCPDVFGGSPVYVPEELTEINITEEIEDWTKDDEEEAHHILETEKFVPLEELDDDIPPDDKLQTIIDQALTDGSIGEVKKIIHQVVPDFPEIQPTEDECRNILVRLKGI